MVGSIIIGVAVFLLLWTVLILFKKGKQKSFEISVIFGFLLAVANYGTIRLPAILGVLLIIPAIFGVFYLFHFWKEEGDTLKEGLLFLIINLIVCVVINNAACRMRDLTSIKWVIATFDSIASVVFIVLVGFMIANVMKFRRELGDAYYEVREEKKKEEKEEKKKEEKKRRKGEDDDEEEGYVQKIISYFWY